MQRLIIPVEGGLGAQIFGIMMLDFLRSTVADKAIVADFRYFDQPPRSASLGEGSSIFPWALDYYGINQSEFCFYTSESSSFIHRLSSKNKSLLLRDGDTNRLEVLLSAIAYRDWSDRFKISEDHYLTAKQYLSDSRSAVIHVRRGDYLNVATHLVNDELIVMLLNKLTKLGIKRIIFLSDSFLNLGYYAEHLSRDVVLDSFVDQDIYLTHALMRLASCLITSNSQFSLSAAILNREAVKIIPKQWYQGPDKKLELQIQKLSDWMIIS